jgi:Ferritin-like domain
VVTATGEADPWGVPSRIASRRKLLGAAGAGGALLLASCGRRNPLHVRVKKAGPVPLADVATLNRLLDLEHLAIAAYTAGIPLLPRSATLAARQFLGQELSHAGELSGLVKEAGGKPHELASAYDLGHPHTGTDVLALLHRIESAQLAAYIQAIPGLRRGPVRAAAAAILANDAQHVAVLRSHLGQRPVPAAFVTGRE